MSLVRVQNFSISLDGFGTGEGQSRDAHFGHAGDSLHEWLFGTRWWQAGGSGGIDDSFARQFDAEPISRVLSRERRHHLSSPGLVRGRGRRLRRRRVARSGRPTRRRDRSRGTRNHPRPATSDRKQPPPARRRRPVSWTWPVRPRPYTNRQSNVQPWLVPLPPPRAPESAPTPTPTRGTGPHRSPGSRADVPLTLADSPSWSAATESAVRMVDHRPPPSQTRDRTELRER
jgi:hypothetical protein